MLGGADTQARLHVVVGLRTVMLAMPLSFACARTTSRAALRHLWRILTMTVCRDDKAALRSLPPPSSPPSAPAPCIARPPSAPSLQPTPVLSVTTPIIAAPKLRASFANSATCSVRRSSKPCRTPTSQHSLGSSPAATSIRSPSAPARASAPPRAGVARHKLPHPAALGVHATADALRQLALHRRLHLRPHQPLSRHSGLRPNA